MPRKSLSTKQVLDILTLVADSHIEGRKSWHFSFMPRLILRFDPHKAEWRHFTYTNTQAFCEDWEALRIRKEQQP